MPVPSSSWLARLSAAATAREVEEAIASVVVLLSELGLCQRDSASNAPVSFGVEYGERKLEFSGTLLDEELLVTVRALLLLLLQRSSMEQELGRVRERMDMLAGASFEGIMIHVDGVIIDANQRLAEMLGYEYEELLGPSTMQRCVAPEDLPMVSKLLRERYEGAYVITGVRKDGSRFRAELQSKQGKLGARPVRVAAVRDVTERERTQALLLESEQRLRELAEAVFDVIVLSRDGIILDLRGPVEQLFGVGREEMLGKSSLVFMAEPSRVVAAQIIKEGRPGSYQVDIVHPSGELVPIEIVGVMATLEGQPVRVAGLRDLRAERKLAEERRALEQRVERGQRLESLGVLAGGIAHDFNNLLVGMLGNADYLLEELKEPAHANAAQSIRRAAERASALTAQMLAYAGQRDRGRREPLEIKGLVEELSQLLGAALSKKAELELCIEPGCTVHGDRATLTQVLMNLLTNASDALAGEPGTIQVHGKCVNDPGPGWKHALGNRVGPGDWVLIEVRDSGGGMSEQTLLRVFEPFFSTKPQGHGLGLAACLGIVAAHGGAIRVESELGRGSQFSVILPRGPAIESAAKPRTSEPREGGSRVLVVDDESVVRSFLRRALERRGYRVTEAADGASGLSILSEQPFDVVLLDMNMPRMSGAEVLKRLRASGSPVPVVLSSGYTEVDLEQELGAVSFQGFLIKPYALTELMETIERALAGPPVTAS